MRIYKHKACTSVGVEVLKMHPIIGKDYVRIKVAWWKLTYNKPMYAIGIIEYLKDASIQGNEDAKRKYPIERWKQEWELIYAN